MKRQELLNLAIAAALFGGIFAGCGDDDDDTMTFPDATDSTPTDTVGGDTTVPGACDGVSGTITVDAAITEDTLWCASAQYNLKGLVYVTDNATLTIEPGTQIFGDAGSALVVTPEGVIDATGTAAAPIVFTSSKAEDQRQPGDWGGVVLLGTAPINVAGGSNQIEGIEPTEANARYGGTDSSHDCGTLNYVRIEYAGAVFGEDNELNGLTTGGCGSDTDLKFIQVYLGLDDGIEMFGGNADLSYVVVTQPGDDGLDFDQGYTGRVQFALVTHGAPSSDDPRGFEWDSDKNDPDVTPRTLSTVFNATVIQVPDSEGNMQPGLDGLTIRRGAGMVLTNAIVANFTDEYLDLRDEETAALFTAGTASITNTIFFGAGDTANDYVSSEEGDSDDDGGFDEAAYLAAELSIGIGVDPQLNAAYVPSNTADTVGVAPPNDGFFDVSATFLGAFEPGETPWTDGWTK